jgi:hypothetical protein
LFLLVRFWPIADGRRGICWRCAKLDMRDIRTACRPQVSYTCGLHFRAPNVERCQFFEWLVAATTTRRRGYRTGECQCECRHRALRERRSFIRPRVCRSQRALLEREAIARGDVDARLQ